MLEYRRVCKCEAVGTLETSSKQEHTDKTWVTDFFPKHCTYVHTFIGLPLLLSKHTISEAHTCLRSYSNNSMYRYRRRAWHGTYVAEWTTTDCRMFWPPCLHQTHTNYRVWSMGHTVLHATADGLWLWLILLHTHLLKLNTPISNNLAMSRYNIITCNVIVTQPPQHNIMLYAGLQWYMWL